jgi:hypothetical protein
LAGCPGYYRNLAVKSIIHLALLLYIISFSCIHVLWSK